VQHRDAALAARRQLHGPGQGNLIVRIDDVRQAAAIEGPVAVRERDLRGRVRNAADANQYLHIFRVEFPYNYFAKGEKPLQTYRFFGKKARCLFRWKIPFWG